MLIDWFTVGAQALNFLILVWLMKRFLYKPVLAAIDAREAKVASELKTAHKKEADSIVQRDLFQHKNDEFDNERDALLAKAKDDAKAQGQQLVDRAQKDSDQLRTTQKDALKKDFKSLEDQVTIRTRMEVFAIARKTLQDLAATSLEQRMGELFTERLAGLDPKAKALLGDALKGSADPAVVRSTFELPAEQHQAIQKAINEAFSAAVPLRFETTPDLICGIELSTTGQKLSWSIASYLDALDKRVAELL